MYFTLYFINFELYVVIQRLQIKSYIKSYYGGNIQRYTPITVNQTAPFQTINLNIDLVVSIELIKQVAF